MLVHDDRDVIVRRQRSAQRRVTERGLERVANRLDRIAERRRQIGPVERNESVRIAYSRTSAVRGRLGSALCIACRLSGDSCKSGGRCHALLSATSVPSGKPPAGRGGAALPCTVQ